MSAPRSLRSSISEVVPHTPVAPTALQTLFMHVAHASRRAIRSVYLEELCKSVRCDELSLSDEVTKLAEALVIGNSSLLMSILEETTLVTVTVKVKAQKIALASHTPFIYPGTLRANEPPVLFCLHIPYVFGQ
ncbi:hypothetical protein C8J57DRAFT_1536436 [Mycena rebaudengoi]|nr:hypothetical protein C8J57DRAFT_1536436 [Mycena rebaudengoi]